MPDMDTLNQNFAEKVEDIGSIQEEDTEFYEKGGGTAAAYSGEEYRQELRKGLETREDQITSLPWAAGSGFKGKKPGYFFCARIGDEVFMRFLPDEIDEEIDEEEDEIVQDTLSCLKRIDVRRKLIGLYPRKCVSKFMMPGRWLRKTSTVSGKSKQTHSTYSRILGTIP